MHTFMSVFTSYIRAHMFLHLYIQVLECICVADTYIYVCISSYAYVPTM